MSTTPNPSPVYGPFVPPQWNPPDDPPGYGEPHPPGGPNGEFSAEIQDLVTASVAWDGLSAALQKVWGYASEGWGYPGLFGMQDTLYTAGRLHQTINEVLVNGAADGHWITQTLANGLVETANDLSGTDTTQGENFRKLKERAGE
ncbi:hypothetical protein GUY44_20180 [Pimelobacter simplex]|uniref:Uncharacterized protein n=1 Tax=Nocardioides simplex TaxID=2045 RepID=A0A0A1DMP5_NOCSI|nr:hypothetical protein [Pimelobacter simplex]AIY17828.1 hypothetical protein KR76_15550 [Pimelobacter simplex]MCG8152813.1 hypothetical protein [Pimelobacter simplex]GEB13477.1 hypothetical protein NSI01_17920 [Pimelobacter simplex]SFM73002.1 hypothetical protein SAMN05421671_3193 [Pimelobacter simplex]